MGPTNKTYLFITINMLAGISSFWFRQIKEESWIAVWRKARNISRKITQIPYYLVALPIMLIIRLLRPLALIKLGKIRSSIIGHYVFDTEYYLCEKDINSIRSLDFFYYDFEFTNKPTNTQWDKMVRRHMRVHPFVAYLYKINRIIPGGQAHTHLMNVEIYKSSDYAKGLLASTEQHICFNYEEKERGKYFLKDLGLKREDQFVCLIVRDSAYKEKYQKGNNIDWSYHNFRDSDIDTYEEAILTLAEKGYWVFRMGKAVHKPLKIKHSRVIDYANKPYRSDFLDIWLMGNCFFCISTGLGLDSVPRVFRKPIVFVNYTGPISILVSYIYSITSPKKMIWRNKNKFLSLSEQIQHAYGKYQDYDNAGIDVIDSSPEEIRHSVMELEAKLSGIWKDSEEDNQLQKRFWEILKAWPEYNKYHGIIHPKACVSNSFLKGNPEWLN